MEERPKGVRRERQATHPVRSLQRFIVRGRARQTLDDRPAEEILGYDKNGLPGGGRTSSA